MNLRMSHLNRLINLFGLSLLLGLPADARCTNYASLSTFDSRKDTTETPDFFLTGVGRLVVETEAGLLPVSVYAPKNAERQYFRNGTGAPVPVSVSIDANACEKGKIRRFTRKYYRKLPMDPPFPFPAPLNSPASAESVEALARTVLSITHCRGGEVKLNHNFTYVDERGSKPKSLSAPALQYLGSGYGDTVWSVHMTCSLWRER